MDISKFKTHLGQAKEFKIGEDKFNFRPLTIEYLPDIFSVINKISQSADSNSPFSSLDKESMNTITNLIRVMIKRSYPELDKEFKEEFIKEGKSEEESKKLADERLEDFIYNNYFSLITALFESNNLGAPKLEDDGKKSGLIEKMKQIKDAKR